MATLLQPSFAKGEISPALYGRVDTAAYQIGLRTARNAVVHAYGGVSNRAGLRFRGPCKTHAVTDNVRLIPFVFKTTDQYMLEFGPAYMRVIRDDSHVTETDKLIVDAAQFDPVVITSVAHGFINGDEVYIADILGMTELNGRRFIVANKTDDTFELTDQVTAANIDGTGYGAYISGGTAARIFTLTTPYLSADLPSLKYAQSADVMTLTLGDDAATHAGYRARELTRTGHTVWTLTVIDFQPAIGPPTAGSVTPQGATGTTTYNYKVTSISDPFEESEPTSVLTTATGNATLSSSNFNLVDWTAPAGPPSAVRYRVYREVHGLYIFIGATETTSFDDIGYTGDDELTPPRIRDPIVAESERPGAVSYFEQRRVFGGSINKPDTSYYTQIGNFSNLNVSEPLQEDDAITATLNSLQVNEIRHFVPGNDLLIFTSGSEWRITGADSGFSAATIKQKPQTTWGCSHVRPAVIGNTTLFVDASGSVLRSFGFSLQLDGYTGADMSLLSHHLLRFRSITDMAHSSAPESIIYMVRNDGKVLLMTFNPEQEVIAWSRWETSGKFQAVGVLRNAADLDGASTGFSDAIYFVVTRRVNGNFVRYIERLGTRRFDSVHACFFVDSGLTYDNPVTITNATAANPVVITAAAHGFSNGDEIDIHDIVWEPDIGEFEVEMQPAQLNGGRYQVANKTANTFELKTLAGDPVDGSAFNAYVEDGSVRETVGTITGLDHLDGRAVACLADGNVVGGLTVGPVTGGIGVVLPRRASRIHVGLSYSADIETLNIAAPGGGTIQGKIKKISKVTVRFEDTRGLFIGPRIDRLTEMKQREFEPMGEPTALLTGDKEVVLEPEWNDNGRIVLRQRYPLPMTILAVIPDLEVGDL